MRLNNILLIAYSLSCVAPCMALSAWARAKGFVYVHEIDPTIRVSLRYHGAENFVGRPVDGYTHAVAIMTRQAAEALKAVQAAVQQDGYSLVVYDAYRPQRAVNHFIRWSTDVADQTMKRFYYPRIDKVAVFDLGYVARRSGHSRGSTVDVTLIQAHREVSDVVVQDRELRDGFVIQFLDDGTLDMGTSFDLLDVASHAENGVIDESFKARRNYLRGVMEAHGFKVSPREWWHFTLRDEPYPADRDDSYFDFEVS